MFLRKNQVLLRTNSPEEGVKMDWAQIIILAVTERRDYAYSVRRQTLSFSPFPAVPQGPSPRIAWRIPWVRGSVFEFFLSEGCGQASVLTGGWGRPPGGGGYDSRPQA